MTGKHYVYTHNRPSTGECFYIGKGVGDRCKGGAKGRNEDWHEIVDQEGGFMFKILVSGLTSNKALEIEKDFIDQIGYDNLCNRVQGGSHKILDTETGVKYNSRREACRSNNIEWSPGKRYIRNRFIKL